MEQNHPIHDDNSGAPNPQGSFFKGCVGCLATLLVVLCVIGLGGYLLYHLEIHYDTIISPCGKYRVEVYYYLGEGFIPTAPGSGSDKAGCLYIYRQADNKKLYRGKLPMLLMTDEIDFYRDDDGSYLVFLPEDYFELEKGNPNP